MRSPQGTRCGSISAVCPNNVKTVELPSTVTFSTNLAKSDMNDLLAYLPDFAIPMKLVDKNPL